MALMATREVTPGHVHASYKVFSHRVPHCPHIFPLNLCPSMSTLTLPVCSIPQAPTIHAFPPPHTPPNTFCPPPLGTQLSCLSGGIGYFLRLGLHLGYSYHLGSFCQESLYFEEVLKGKIGMPVA